MRKKLLLIFMLLFVLNGCANNENLPQTQTGEPDAESGITDSITKPKTTEPTIQGQSEPDALGYVTEGTEEYRGFIIDNVLHSESDGDIHYNVYIPESYDAGKPYALFFASLDTFDKGKLATVIDRVLVYSEERIEIIWKTDDWFFIETAGEKEVIAV